MSKETIWLQIEGIHFSLKQNPPEGQWIKFNISAEYRTLKEAFDALQKYPSIAFDEKRAKENNVGRIIEQAGIVKGADVLLLKSFTRRPHGSDLPSGLYIQLNTKIISPELFYKETGFQLQQFIKKGPVLDYFLIESLHDLTKKLQKNIKPLQEQNKKDQDNGNKGPKL